jgi:two-component system, repressor protein LuxO
LKTLIVEDSATLCVVYSQYLDGCGLDVMAVETLADASAALTEWAPELILLDIELPDGDGLELLNNADQMSHKPAVVAMTGHGSGHAERAIKQGAADFLEKPFDAARLRVTLLNSAEKLKLDRQVRRLSIKREHLGPLLGGSSAMQTVFDTVESLAGTVATALVMGESGTGKELVARAIHQLSARAPEPFVLVDCASLAPDQVERALFGTVETGYQGLVAQAKNGTLFLDEVCSLSYESQSTLLRLIQHGAYRPVGGEHEVAAEVRIIASTNRDPLFEMQEGRLREDLYYRLHVVPLRMPALRERGDDILMLAEHMLARIAEEEGREAAALESAAAEVLRTYSWPGNVRQLENTIRQLILMESAAFIQGSSVSRIITGTEVAASQEERGQRVTSREVISDKGIEPLWLTERKVIEAAIEACNGSINRAARYLEVAPSTIYRKIQSWKAQDA